MNHCSMTQQTNLRFNVLAAALAIALPLGSLAQASSVQTAVRSNHAPAGQPHQPIARDSANKNAPFRVGGSLRPVMGSGGGNSPATVHVVTHCLDDGSPGSLRDAIGLADDNDTIDLTDLSCSTITLQSGMIFFTADNVTIQGPGRDKLTIDGNHASTIFASVSDSGELFQQDLILTDLTLANGNFTYGGCVYVDGNLTLENVTISGCSASSLAGSFGTFGGAVDSKRDLTMINSVISNNFAEGPATLGGGAYVGGVLRMSQNSVISGNQAVSHGDGGFYPAMGGGAFVLSGVSMTDSNVTGNVAQADHNVVYGGGLAIFGHADQSPASVALVNSTVSGNSALSGGGWVYGGGINAGITGAASGFGNVDSGKMDFRPVSLQLTDSTIADNEVRSECPACVLVGGGLHATATVNLQRSTLSGNRVVAGLATSATAYGGGAATRLAAGQDPQQAVISILQSTISGNVAAGRAGSQGGVGRGGGVAALSSPVRVTNSTIAFNQASDNAGGLFLGIGDGSKLDSSIVANNQAPAAADLAARPASGNLPTVVVAGSNNIVPSAEVSIQLPTDTLQLDPRLQSLAWNGGPTMTHAFRFASPAIDAGSNPKAFACDQRGMPYGRAAGVRADIGSYEMQSEPVGAARGPSAIFINGFDGNGPCG